MNRNFISWKKNSTAIIIGLIDIFEMEIKYFSYTSFKQSRKMYGKKFLIKK